MTPKEFIQATEEYSPQLPPKEILKGVDFVHNGKESWDESDDLNADFREGVVDAIFQSEKPKNGALIRYLLAAEIEYCKEETCMRESLRQLTFMLYEFGEIEDIPLLFEAKKDSCFDAGIGLDIELIFGKDMEKTKDHFRRHPHQDYDILGCIEEYDDGDIRSPEEFIAAMNSYYGRT